MKIILITLLLTVFSACASFEPQYLDYKKVAIPNQERSIEYGVYTPPGWTKEESLPLVLFLHGGGDTHTSFEKYQTHQYFDEQISLGNMPRIILVTPNGKNGFWENWYDGSHLYRDWVLNDVIPSVQQNYNTLDCPDHCHLAGISMGGFGALRFAYFANNIFSSVSAISAPILSEVENKQAQNSILINLLFPLKRIFGPNLSENYASEAIEKVWIDKENTQLQDIRLQLIWGDDDRKQIMTSNQRFHDTLTTEGIEHDYHVYNGGHKWVYWIPNFNRVINFLVNDYNK